jgi:hypothetical protein
MLLARAFLALQLLLTGTLAMAQLDAWVIPPSVAWMYVYVQQSDVTGPGSVKEIGNRISPAEFAKNLQSYIETARRAKMKLIVSAQSLERTWVHDTIRYRGKKLEPAPYYEPNGGSFIPGVEVPLD